MTNKYPVDLISLRNVIDGMFKMQDEIEEACIVLSESIMSGGTIYIIGNGGSAAEANHFAGEIVGRFRKERKGLPCISLVTDNAAMTAISNDYGYDSIFERQLEAFYNPKKDILITLSSSGNSDNINRAIEYVGELGGFSINLIGKDGGLTSTIEVPKLDIVIPSDDTPRIQEMQLFLLHFFADYIEEKYVEKRDNMNERINKNE